MQLIVVLFFFIFTLLVLAAFAGIASVINRHKCRSKIKTALKKYNYKLIRIELIGNNREDPQSNVETDLHFNGLKKQLSFIFYCRVFYTDGTTEYTCRAKVTQFLFLISYVHLEI